MDLVLVSLILIVLFGIVFSRGFQGYHIGRFLLIALYFLLGVSFGALAVGLILQALKTEPNLTQAILLTVGAVSGALGLRFLKDMSQALRRS